MAILACDPSYRGFGVCVKDSETFLFQERLDPGLNVYDSLENVYKAVYQICNRLWILLNAYDIDTIVVEYPAIQSRGGAILGILNGALSLLFRKYKVIWVPPNAVDAYIKNSSHSKSFIVSYCKEKGFIDKRTSHDICTAMVLCQICEDILNSKYKKKYFITVGE